MAEGRERGRGRRDVMLFFAGNVWFAAGLFIHAFSFNFYLRELGWSATAMGVQVTAMTVGGLAALLPAGVLIDRRGARAALLAGTAVTTVGLATSALARNLSVILGAAVLIGVGGATCRVAFGPALMRLGREGDRARLFTWNVALLIGSGALWTALAGAAPAWTTGAAHAAGMSGTQLVLLAGAGVSLLGLACYWPLQLGPAEQRGPMAPAALPPRNVRLLIPLIALWMLAEALVLPFFNIFFSDRFAMPVSWIATTFAAAQIARAVILVASAELVRRCGTQRVLAWWMATFAPSLWCLAAVNSVPTALGLFLVQGCVGPATNPLIDQLVLERVTPDQHGIVASWRNAAAEAAGAVGAAVGGRLLDATSFSILYLAAGAVAMTAGIALVAGLRRAGSAALAGDSRAI